MHNTPFGDIVDTEDDLQPLVASMFRDARARGDARRRRRCGRRVRRGAARGARRRGRDHAHRAGGSSGARRTASRSATAHAIAARLLPAQRDSAGDAGRRSAWPRVSGDLLGVPLTYSDAQMAEILSPRHFVEVQDDAGRAGAARDTLALNEATRVLAADRAWLTRVSARRSMPRDALASRAESRHCDRDPAQLRAGDRRLGHSCSAASICSRSIFS